MRILLSSILAFLAMVSSARAGIVSSALIMGEDLPDDLDMTAYHARKVVRESLTAVGLKECPDDQDIPIQDTHVTMFSGFPVLGMGDLSDRITTLYRANLFAVGIAHCLYKLNNGGKKYNRWFVLTRRGETKINLEKDLTIDDKLLSYGSTGEGQYKWVLVYPNSLNDDLRFAGLNELDLWKEKAANAKSKPEKIEDCLKFFNDVYGKMAKLTPELQFRSKVIFPVAAYFDVVRFNKSFKWFTINPDHTLETHPTAEDIVKWDMDTLSLQSEFPLRDNGRTPGVCLSEKN
ncbi:hypothetical protein FRC03_001887 [Tulasnella sp. 419]|nr:hypothetical protein FRC03_001887 [Tulasnella sp. 419]